MGEKSRGNKETKKKKAEKNIKVPAKPNTEPKQDKKQED